MKRYFIMIALLGLILVGCGKQPLMDELDKDNNYHYRNKDLGFELKLPSEFIYYQTQKVHRAGYVDLEVLVPTGDREYSTIIPGYAKPLYVRIFSNENWQELLNERMDSDEFVVIGNKKDKTYTLRFWDKIPTDWANKWSDEMKQKLIDNFVIK